MKIKKNPKANLEQYSNVFSLLGLVLSLFIAFVFIEHKTYAAEKTCSLPSVPLVTMNEIPTMIDIIREEKKPKTLKIEEIKEPVETPVKPVDFIDPTKFKKTENNIEIIEKPIASTDETINDTPTDLTDIIYTEEAEESITETIHFVGIDNAPVFPGCEKYIHNNEKSKKCFSKNMAKFFSKNFDIGIAEEMGLSGIQKINCQFIIDSNGEISPDIQTSKTYPELANEIKGVLQKLPKMIPAKQNGKPVNLIYMLPVRFRIE